MRERGKFLLGSAGCQPAFCGNLPRTFDVRSLSTTREDSVAAGCRTVQAGSLLSPMKEIRDILRLFELHRGSACAGDAGADARIELSPAGRADADLRGRHDGRLAQRGLP